MTPTDTFQGFFGVGHALFRTTPETYPIRFVVGNVFDPNLLQIVPPFDHPSSTGKPDLSTLTSLNPLSGRCAVIYAARFSYLFFRGKPTSSGESIGRILVCSARLHDMWLTQRKLTERICRPRNFRMCY
ncbi:hypothetical protein JVU11DRAFT_2118 [Chiua virens]|nr:hypothetical protein JVU11DRAFT_2118 [Chiua virens]